VAGGKDQFSFQSQRIDAFKTVVLEKTLESPLDNKEIKSFFILKDKKS